MEFTSDNVAAVGNKGKGIRSDCFVTMELAESGGIQLELMSKVESMYGASIRELVNEVMDFFDVKNTRILVEDSGALPLVLAARLEAAVKLLVKTEK